MTPDRPILPKFRSDHPKIGDRIVVRRKLFDASGNRAETHFTDVIGHVVELDPLVVRPQSIGGLPSDAPTITIPEEHVEVVKILTPRTVRNSDIRSVEVATAKAFPGLHNEWVDGWLLRAGDGIAERSNSAVPLGPSCGFNPVPIDAIMEFYRSHDLPPQLLVPERIGKPALKLIASAPDAWHLGPEIIQMVRPLEHFEPVPLPTGLSFRIDDQPDDDWLRMYHFRGRQLPAHALELLRSRIDGAMGFGRLLDADGATIAITRGTITSSDHAVYLGYSAVEVDPAWRRRGLGTALGLRMLEWGTDGGADTAYLQVISTNTAGIGLYGKLGFTEHHRHRYARFEG